MSFDSPKAADPTDFVEFTIPLVQGVRLLSNARVFVCEDCVYNFTNQKDLEEHQEQCHLEAGNTPKDNLVCNQ